MRTIIKNVRLVQGGQILPRNIILRDDRIEETTPPGSPGSSREVYTIDGKGLYLSHGFLDIHVHGGGGADFMDGTGEAWHRIAALHLKHGTTGMVPTTLSASLDELLRTFEVFEQRRNSSDDGAKLLGLHLEGPYFSPTQSGAQDPGQLRQPEPSEYEYILERCPGILRWSLAPEIPGALDMGKRLAEKGIVAAIGHSDATYKEVERAVECGYTHVTHLYSATSTVTRELGFRRGGIVEAAYLMPELTSEVIADGCHLPAELLQMAYRFIGPKRLALITDAMRGAGQEEGESILGSLEHGQRVIIEDGVAKMPDRKAFAGSVCTADRLVRNMVELAGASLPDAVEMATRTPARIMGKEHVTGTVAPGRKADLVLFDDNIHIHKVWTDGVLRYEDPMELSCLKQEKK